MTAWNRDCYVDDCGDREAFYVEWNENAANGHTCRFAGFYCNKHTSALRAGWSPFEEWGTTPTVVLMRTVEAQQALCEQSRVQP